MIPPGRLAVILLLSRSERFVVMRGFALLVILTSSAAASAENKPWIDLMKPDVWSKFDERWIATDTVKLDEKNSKKLIAEKVDKGTVWVNGPGRVANLITKQEFADCEIEIEFLIAKGSNAGVKFHSLYEIQILDTFGKDVKTLTGNSMGGIYPRARNGPPYGYEDDGTPPKVNAANKPGEWNKLTATWKAPRFDAAGKLTEHGIVVRAELNGKLIHDNVTVKTPTGANWVKPNTAKGLFMVQADHGPTAIRLLRIR